MDMDSSGVSRVLVVPSNGDTNSTPSSVMDENFSSETIWKLLISLTRDKPSRVGQHGPIPFHEFVQSAQLRQELFARLQRQVIRVPQDDVAIELLQLQSRQAWPLGLRQYLS